jgi:hypothetical protein
LSHLLFGADDIPREWLFLIPRHNAIVLIFDVAEYGANDNGLDPEEQASRHHKFAHQ